MHSPAKDLRALTRPDTDRPPVPRPTYPWKTRLLLPALLVIAVLLLLAYASRDALWPAVEVRVVPVVVKAGAETSAGGTAVQAAGWVEADPYPVAVSALTDGVVREILVLEGERVTKGQAVARLVDDDAKLALAKAQAQLQSATADLYAARSAWDNPVERTRSVSAAEASVAETKAELAELESKVQADAARAEELQEQANRTAMAFEGKAVPEFDVVRTKLQAQTAAATLEATKARQAVLEAQLRQRQVELTAARDNARLRIEETKALEAARAAVAQAQAARDEAQLRLSRMEVRSPADGVVMTRHVAPGSKLMLGSDDPHSATVVRLFDPQHLQVRVDVPLADAAKVGVGMEAKVVVSVLPDRTFDGKVTRVVSEADLAKNTLQVKVAITDPAAELKPEMLARVRLISPATAAPAQKATATQLIFAPESLIQNNTAWIVDRSTNTAQRRTVEPGTLRQEGWISIRSGLNAGDQLIAEPSGIREGTKVEVIGEAEQGGTHGIH